MPSMNSAEIRVLTKMVQILRQEHKQSFQYSDPDLAEKVGSAVQRLSDPILSALWQSLPESVRKTSSVSSDSGSARKTRMYRGQMVGGDTDVNQAGTAKTNRTENQTAVETGSGRYVTYRGSRTWVPN